MGRIDQDKYLASFGSRRERMTLDRGHFLAGVPALGADIHIGRRRGLPGQV